MIISALSGCRKKYPETVDKYLTDGVDYVDHSSTYDGEGLTYHIVSSYVSPSPS